MQLLQKSRNLFWCLPLLKDISFKELIELEEVNTCSAVKAIGKFGQDCEAKVWSRFSSSVFAQAQAQEALQLLCVAMLLLGCYYAFAMPLLCNCLLQNQIKLELHDICQSCNVKMSKV